MKIKLFIFIITSLVVWSCTKPQVYPPEPYIEFDSFTLTDTIDPLDNPAIAGNLLISFIDGDGDIGLTEADTFPPYDTIYDKNLFLSIFAKEDGEFVEQELTVPIAYRIKDISPKGQNKTLKGKINVLLYYDNSFTYDTFKYSIFIYDRDLNKSNVIFTPDLILE